MKRVAALVLLATIAMPARAAEPAPAPAVEPARSYPTGKLTIAGQAFAVGEIADARAMPDINKKVGVMVSLTPEAARRLETITRALVGKPVELRLDGTMLGAELIRKPLANGVIELPGRWTLGEAEALARRISGRDPLPDDLGME
jgi:preprotein translocase subunit SecD